PHEVSRRASHPAPPSAPRIVQRRDERQRPSCPWFSRLHSHRPPARFQAVRTISSEKGMPRLYTRFGPFLLGVQAPVVGNCLFRGVDTPSIHPIDRIRLLSLRYRYAVRE